MSHNLANYELYGWEVACPERVLQLVSDALTVDFSQHESEYWGTYYLSGPPASEHFEIKGSRDAEGELVEPEFPSYSTLLYANRTTRPDELAQTLARIDGAVRLRSETLPC